MFGSFAFEALNLRRAFDYDYTVSKSLCCRLQVVRCVLMSARVFLQKGKIPLLLAVEAGNQSMVRELLGQSSAEQLRATTDHGDTALHLAARRRDLDMVRILVDYGTNVDLPNVSTASDRTGAPAASALEKEKGRNHTFKTYSLNYAFEVYRNYTFETHIMKLCF